MMDCQQACRATQSRSNSDDWSLWQQPIAHLRIDGTDAASAHIDPVSHTALFRMETWDSSKQADYKVMWQGKVVYSGQIKADPPPPPSVTQTGHIYPAGLLITPYLLSL